MPNDQQLLAFDREHPEAPRFHAAMDCSINNVLHLFGFPVTLLLGASRTKVVITNEDEISKGRTIQKCFKSGEIRIQCGSESAGLAAVEFSTISSVKRFLHLNPDFGQTVITQCGNRVAIWFSVDAEGCPPDQTLKTCTWVSSNSLSVSSPAAESYFLGFKPVVRRNFSDLRWDDEDSYVWREVECQNHYGPPITGGKGNIDFWAAFFLAIKKLSFCHETELFFSADSKTPLSSGQVSRMLIEFVQDLSGRDLEIMRILQGAALARLMRTTKTLALSSDVGEEFGIETFIASGYEKHDGESTTISDILVDYESFLRAKGILRASQKVNWSVRSIVLARFGLTVSKSILRDGRQQNGFRGLRRRCKEDPTVVASS